MHDEIELNSTNLEVALTASGLEEAMICKSDQNSGPVNVNILKDNNSLSKEKWAYYQPLCKPGSRNRPVKPAKFGSNGEETREWMTRGSWAERSRRASEVNSMLLKQQDFKFLSLIKSIWLGFSPYFHNVLKLISWTHYTQNKDKDFVISYHFVDYVTFQVTKSIIWLPYRFIEFC